MKKSTQRTNRRGSAMIVTGAVIFLVLIASVWTYFELSDRGYVGKATLNAGSQRTTSLGAVCPDTLTTASTITLYNALNTSGSESFDANFRLYDTQGNLITTGTDTTSGAIQIGSGNLPCGQTFVLRLLTSNADGGDSAKILGIRGNPGAAEIIEDGRALKFTTEGAAMNFEINGKQHGLMEARAFDIDNNAFMYDSGDITNTVYELDGTTFTSTTDNATALAVGSGGKFQLRMQVRSTGTDTDVSDLGMYILVEAPTTDYEAPVISYDGKQLTDMKGSLNVYESRLWSSYEYVYFVENSLTDDGATIDMKWSALSGVNPTNDIEVDFAAKGSAQETAGSGVIYSGATDASSSAAIYTVQDFTFDLS